MKNNSNQSSSAKLRRQAEQRLQEHKTEQPLPGAEHDARRLLHELQVHQIELEMQNEELTAARVEIEAGLERYTDLYDFAPVGYFTLDHDGTICQVNITGASLLGVERVKLVHCRMGCFVAPAELGRWNQYFESLLQSADKQTCELAFTRTDGSTFHVRLESTRLDRPAQGATGDYPSPIIRVVMSDITERKQLEAYGEMGREILQILNESKDFRESIECILTVLKTRADVDAVGIRLQDGDDFPYFVQKGFSKDFLLAENSLIERAADGAVCRNKDGNVSLECTCGLVISGKTDPANPLFTPGGSVWTNDSLPLLAIPPHKDPRHHPRNKCIHHGYASVALVPIRNGNRIVGLVQFNDRRKGRFTLGTVELLEGIASHIGAALMRKRMEDVLRKSEERLRLALQGADLGSWDWDVVTGKVEFNERWAAMLGYSPADIEPHVRAWEALVHPDDRADVQETLSKHLNGQTSAYENEHRMRHKSGAWIWVLDKGKVIERNASGQPVRICGTHLDITEHKQTEMALQQVAEELERSNQELKQFAYVASHDLQEPLRQVTGFMKLLQDRYKGKLDEKADEYIHYAADGAARMSNMITDLLAYSLVSTDDLEPCEVSCQEALDRALANLGAAISDSGALVTHDPLPTLTADRAHISQLFQNLIGNALKFRREGVTPEIHIGAKPEGDQWILCVKDNGIGIPPEQFERVFMLFQRLHGREKYPGTGIGLAICKKIVERLGGRIWVESKVGEGTTFYFVL